MRKLIGVGLIAISFNVLSAPKSELWSYWQQSNEASTVKVSHQQWQAILDTYLVVEGQHHLFRYSAVTAQDDARLNNYLSNLAQQNPHQLSKAEQYAYWVNMYNAITVDLILQEYPIKSITKLGGLFSFGPWDEEVITVNGKELTLNDIEHKILRPIWNDPRTHYAVNCASLGCPNLQLKAFSAQNSEALLEQAAIDFINSDKGVLVKGNKLNVSSIYEWFSVDFDVDGGVKSHIEKYRTNLPAISGSFSYDYDWSLNEKK
ncbi:DUF547 domain-containing protein [Vibrio intestinalis]|uniref:DUF547 domain-containing protein n=1 Tax=Vibrio intestinalis TaxID=2933291 RepID=UPI0021A444C2|nr:DUF547 domain-containing protein [Vibrio intestinalis]